jgi:hypothetical protein
MFMYNIKPPKDCSSLKRKKLVMEESTTHKGPGIIQGKLPLSNGYFDPNMVCSE